MCKNFVKILMLYFLTGSVCMCPGAKSSGTLINKESHYVIVKAIFQLGGQILTLPSRVPLNPAVSTKSAEAMDLYCSKCLQTADTP